MCELISQGLWLINATERKNGRGANLLAYNISVLIRSFSPENFTVDAVIMSQVEVLLFKTKKKFNCTCILCFLRYFPEDESCVLFLNIGQIMQGCTVAHPRRQ